ncbi:MAG: molecular chaperone HscC [Porticoccaceae bacterium]|jgi:molecular chaperone HscC
MGAAVQAALIAKDSSLEDLVVTDVSPFTLGIETIKHLAGDIRDGYFSPIINRNTTIPVSQHHRYGTVEPNQTQLRVKVFQGESRTVKDNLLIGEFVVKEIPPGPAGQEVDIRFTYDLNGVLEIEATVVETQRKVTHVVTRYAEGLSNREIGQAIRDMGSLKTHPREESENRFLLRWGERLFRELPLTNRNRLESMLSGFEEALDRQDEALIERHREALRLFLSALDSDSDSDSGEGDSDA